MAVDAEVRDERDGKSLDPEAPADELPLVQAVANITATAAAASPARRLGPAGALRRRAAAHAGCINHPDTVPPTWWRVVRASCDLARALPTWIEGGRRAREHRGRAMVSVPLSHLGRSESDGSGFADSPVHFPERNMTFLL